MALSDEADITLPIDRTNPQFSDRINNMDRMDILTPKNPDNPVNPV
jgi:hypothetical protein